MFLIAMYPGGAILDDLVSESFRSLPLGSAVNIDELTTDLPTHCLANQTAFSQDKAITLAD